MRVLLDTHLLPWSVASSRRLPNVYRLHQSGEMRDLYVKWFGAEPLRVAPGW